MLYKIHVSLHSSVRNADLWTFDTYKTRLVKVKNTINKKEVILSYRKIDSNFLDIYNSEQKRIHLKESDSSIIIEEYYRNRLGVNKNRSVELVISEVKSYNILLHLKYLRQHVNDTVRITYWIAVVSIVASLYKDIINLVSSLYLHMSTHVYHICNN